MQGYLSRQLKLCTQTQAGRNAQVLAVNNPVSISKVIAGLRPKEFLLSGKNPIQRLVRCVYLRILADHEIYRQRKL